MVFSGAKRAFIYDCAKHLSLGGFSKVGYPGIVVIEGDKLDVMDFVNRVQRLRWKHMVVRGEEIERLFPDAGAEADARGRAENAPSPTYISEDSARRLVNAQRKFPPSFLGELGDTSEAGSICEQCGAHELFLTSMKIYTSDS
jgi:hypothetical protein